MDLHVYKEMYMCIYVMYIRKPSRGLGNLHCREPEALVLAVQVGRAGRLPSEVGLGRRRIHSFVDS